MRREPREGARDSRESIKHFGCVSGPGLIADVEDELPFEFFGFASGVLALTELIVRRFLCNDHIMWMAFKQACIGDTGETSFRTQVFQ